MRRFLFAHQGLACDGDGRQLVHQVQSKNIGDGGQRKAFVSQECACACKQAHTHILFQAHCYISGVRPYIIRSNNNERVGGVGGREEIWRWLSEEYNK
jgi:hypothetical protein